MKKLYSSQVLLIFLVFSYNTIAQTVYITKTGSKYHNDDCRYQSQSKISIDLATAISKGYGACSVCKPSTQATSNTKSSTTTETKVETKQQVNTSKTVTSQKCAAITKAGTRCSRKSEI